MPRATVDFLPFTIMVGKVLFHLHMPPYTYVHSDLAMIPDMGGFGWKYMGRGLRCMRETSRCGGRIIEDLLCCVRWRLGGDESLH